MRCFSDQELVKAEMGELTLNQVSGLDEHLGACSRCAQARDQVRQLAADIALASEATQADGFVERVMGARDRLQADPGKRSGRRLFVPLFAAAAMVLVVAGVAHFSMDHRGTKETWTARGRGDRARVSLRSPASEVLVMRGGQLLPLSGQALSPTDAFAVRYVNPTNDPQYLAAFAVDAAGAVHWIFPEYTDAATDPSSILLATAKDERLLPQVVAPEKPSPGPMHVVTLTSQAPASVKQVEGALRDAPAGLSAGRALARLYPNALIREWSCSWNAR